MSVPSKSSKLWWTLLVQSRLLQRASNNFNGVSNGSESSTFKGFIGVQRRGFRSIGLWPMAHEASQPCRWLMHSGFSTEVEQNSGESVVDMNDTVEPAIIQEDNISKTSWTTVLDASRQVFVGNLPRSIKKQDLVQLFSEYGKVLDARIVYYQKDKKGRVFAFIHFESQTEVESAVAALHRKEFRKRLLVVKEGKVQDQE